MAALGEEEIIALLGSAGCARPDVCLGIGDDGAVLQPRPGYQLVSVLDTLNEGVHFPAGLPAASVAHRALAANLSDLAAMGSEPAWATLALSLPYADADWVTDFAQGFGALAERHQLALIGGDTVRGPLAVTVQLTGYVEQGRAMRRDGAGSGDRIVISGVPGEAAAGLARMGATDPGSDALRQRFLWPEPRVALGRSLAGLATAAIDVSDGLVTDLTRLTRASGIGARLELDKLPVSEVARRELGGAQARRLALVGGDDYELCFTVCPDDVERLPDLASEHGCRLTDIGEITVRTGCVFLEAGREIEPDLDGSWQHFPEGND